MAGRPSKLTPERQSVIVGHLERGLFRGAAASLSGIDESTFHAWYSKGANEPRGKHRAFYDAVNLAEATFQKTSVEALASSSATNPKIMQWMLSRRFPQLYGRRDNVQVVDVQDKNAKADQLRELLTERLSRLMPEPEAVEALPATTETAAPSESADPLAIAVEERGTT